MTAAAAFVREHYTETAATIRHLFGLSVHDFGTSACRWREAIALLKTAANDTDTWLAVKVHGLSYRAREDHSITNALLIGFMSEDSKAAEENRLKILPWPEDAKTRQARPEPVTADEYEAATRAMLADFGVPAEQFEAELAGVLAAKRLEEKTERELRELEEMTNG